MTGDKKASPRRVLLGHVAGAHGIRGEVLIKSYTAAPEDIDAYGPLTDEAGARSFTITSARVATKGVIARVEGVTSRSEAEALKGVALYIARERLPALAEGEYYHVDLVGLAVVDRQGASLGETVAVLNFGAGDILEISPVGAGATTLIPMTPDFIVEVDIAAGRIVAVLPTDAPESED